MNFRVGQGYDVHQLVAGRKLILGGVEIPHPTGLLGHSDADALLHAITDALLGAVALGDIGRHFPDTDPRYQGADSRVLLRAAVALLADFLHLCSFFLPVCPSREGLEFFRSYGHVCLEFP